MCVTLQRSAGEVSAYACWDTTQIFGLYKHSRQLISQPYRTYMSPTVLLGFYLHACNRSLTDLNPSVRVPVLDHDDEPRPALGEVERSHTLAPLVPRPLGQGQVDYRVRHQVVRRVQLWNKEGRESFNL